MIKGSEIKSRGSWAVTGDGGQACEERDERTVCFREAESCSQETRQPLREQLQILNEAKCSVNVWFPI